jgi:deoxyribonuclease IV
VALIGSHATVMGGLATGALAYAADVGAEVIQVFVSNPRGWATGPGDPAEDVRLRESGIPVFIHAPYLINLGSGDPDVAAKSAAAVAHALRRGREIGARGVVVHTGSAAGWAPAGGGGGHPGPRDRALRQVASLLLPLLDKLGDDAPDLLLEPMAGQGQMLCARAADLAGYLDALERHPKAGVCLDTCHVFAAGHDLTAPGGVSAMLTEVLQAAGPGRVKLVHANDSLLGSGSKRDRHEAIGAGAIGVPPFRELLAHPALADVPFVVETPGGKAGHARDIALLKDLAEDPRAESPAQRAQQRAQQHAELAETSAAGAV